MSFQHRSRASVVPLRRPFRPGRALLESLELRRLLEGVVGDGTGLTGTYYDELEFTGSAVTRVDPVVNFDLGAASPHPSIAPDFFSVVWTGQVQAQLSEPYEFITRSDDGVRLYLDGQLIIDNWTDHPPLEDRSAPVPLVAGQKYDLRMEWYEQGGGATAQLMWAGPSTPQQIIPQTQLYPVDTGDGLQVTLTGHSGRYEGQGVEVSATASGGQGPYTFSWFTMLNGELHSLNSGSTYGATIPDDGLFEITFIATDAAGATGSATWVVRAEEVAPRLFISGPAYVNEEQEFEVQLSKSDAQEDHVEWWHVDWGDGSDPDGDGVAGQFAYGETATASHAYADEGQYTISFTMKDKEGVHAPIEGGRYRLTDVMGTWHDAEAEAVALGGHLVAINSEAEHGMLIDMFLQDSPPTAYWIGLTDAQEYTTEGSYVWTTGEPMTYTDWNYETGEPNNYWGPGSEDYVAMNFQTWIGHPGHVGSWNDMPADQYPFRGIVELETSEPLVVTVMDTQPDDVDVEIVNVPSPAFEGTVYSIGATVNGTQDAIGHYAWTVRRGDEVVGTSSERNLRFIGPDDGTFTVTLDYTRAGGDGHGEATATVTVVNLAPQIDGLGAGSGFLRGEPISFVPLFSDAGALDTHEIRYDFGDGTDTPFIAVENGIPSPEHAYERLGTYTLTVQVRDDDGGVTTATQTLEIVPAIAMVNDGRTEWLAIAGTGGDDEIRISTSRGGRAVVTVNGEHVDVAGVPDPERIIIHARGGDDRVRVSRNARLPIEVYGEAGDDDIFGGPAGDILVGGGGNDRLHGGAGRDILIGGAGRDQLAGQQGEDIVVGGSTAHDSERAGLLMISLVWSRTDLTAAERREMLADAEVVGPYLFNAAGVIDDSESDQVVGGGAGEDWIFEPSSKTPRAAPGALRVLRRIASVRRVTRS